MSIEKIEKSNMINIESELHAIAFQFGKDNPALKERLDEVLIMVKEEKESKENMKDVLFLLANKL